MKLKTIIEGREAAARAMETVTSFDAGFALAQCRSADLQDALW